MSFGLRSLQAPLKILSSFAKEKKSSQKVKNNAGKLSIQKRSHMHISRVDGETHLRREQTTGRSHSLFRPILLAFD